jgi:phosphatidylserine/phosphatidylglycerophosphate/cardiolipin synthase-like enzyme
MGQLRTKIFLLLLIMVVGLPACRPMPAIWLDPIPTTTSSEFISADQIISVYFTAPGNDEFRGGPDQFLVEAINQARSQVDVAIYDLNLWSIRNALIRAHNRGILVRVVVEGDSLDRPEIQEIISSGISVIPNTSENLMHNKFLVIDHSEVWTGSMNFTVNGAYRHLNNLVRVRSSLLAENYVEEFEEMFLEGYFGEDSLVNTPHPRLEIDGLILETYFSPDDSTAERIIDLILEADKSIIFMFYAFTSDGIADAILYQKNQGIKVQGVFDAYQDRTGLGGEYQRLRDGDVDVRLDGHPEKMHHKVLIIDERIVITGSYNLTRSAELKNDENTLIIHNEEIADVFINEFNWIYQDGNVQ